MSGGGGFDYYHGNDLSGIAAAMAEQSYDEEIAALEAKTAAVEHENLLDEIGKIPLLAGSATSSRTLESKKVSVEDWQWALHEAEKSLSDCIDPEVGVIKRLLALGKRYAIARYAKWETLDYEDALTASIPNGIEALLEQFVNSDHFANLKGSWSASQIQTPLISSEDTFNLTAYRRAGEVVNAGVKIHQRPE